MGKYLVPPPGYHFEPTDEELITFYLQKKVSKQPLPANCIVEKKVYGKEANPWDVFGDDDPWEISTSSDKMGTKTLKKTVYAFTTLSKSGKKRISRIAGCGIWDGQTGATMIKNYQGNIIGSKKMFTFETKGDLLDDVKKIHGHWIMHEYSLDGVSLVNGLKFNEVICKITRTWKGKDLALIKSKKRSRTMDDNQNLNGDDSKYKKPRMMVPTSTDMQEVVHCVSLPDTEVVEGGAMVCKDSLDVNFSLQWSYNESARSGCWVEGSDETLLILTQETTLSDINLGDIDFDLQETMIWNDLDVNSSLECLMGVPSLYSSSHSDWDEGSDNTLLHQSEGFTADGFVIQGLVEPQEHPMLASGLHDADDFLLDPEFLQNVMRQ